jgi:hypothetical protein
MLQKVTCNLRDIPDTGMRKVREPVHARRSGLARVAFVKFDRPACLGADRRGGAALLPSGQDRVVAALG